MSKLYRSGFRLGNQFEISKQVKIGFAVESENVMVETGIGQSTLHMWSLMVDRMA